MTDSQPKKRLSKHIIIADSPTTLSQSTVIRANHSALQTAWEARKHPTPWSSRNQEVGKMVRKLSSVSAMMAIMLQLCVWHMNLIHPRALKYQRKIGGSPRYHRSLCRAGKLRCCIGMTNFMGIDKYGSYNKKWNGVKT